MFGKTHKTKRWVGSCLRKVAYRSLDSLKMGAERLSEKYGGNIPVHGYFCVHCGHYHLTTKDYTEEQKRRTNNLIF